MKSKRQILEDKLRPIVRGILKESDKKVVNEELDIKLQKTFANELLQMSDRLKLMIAVLQRSDLPKTARLLGNSREIIDDVLFTLQ